MRRVAGRSPRRKLRPDRRKVASNEAIAERHRSGGSLILNAPPAHLTRAAQSRPRLWRSGRHRSIPMLDIIMLAIALVFFAVSVGYAYACERL
jgi:hypothetical protein